MLRKCKLTVDSGARPNLVLPLRRHDLSVGAGNLDAREQASLVVRLHNVSAHDLASAITAVVRALWGGEAVLWPPVGPAGGVEEGVLLLEAEPELVVGVLLHQLVGVGAEVVCVGFAIGHPGLGHNEDVVPAAERVWVHRSRAEVDIGVVAWGLASGRAVEVPFWEVLDGVGLLREGL